MAKKISKKSKIALLVYGSLFLLVTRVKRVVDGLQLRFNGIENLMTFANNGVSKLRINLLLRNTLPFGVTINSITGKIYMQGEPVSGYDNDVEISTPVVIKPKSITPISIDIYVTWMNLTYAIRDNILSGDIRTFTAQFIGEMVVNGRAFPVDKTISYYDLAR